jgi:hypothetical protein
MRGLLPHLALDDATAASLTAVVLSNPLILCLYSEIVHRLS